MPSSGGKVPLTCPGVAWVDARCGSSGRVATTWDCGRRLAREVRRRWWRAGGAETLRRWPHKFPDETRRLRPKLEIIAAGMHPHPGPFAADLDWGWNDPEGQDRLYDEADCDGLNGAGGDDGSRLDLGADAAWYDLEEQDEANNVCLELVADEPHGNSGAE